MSESIDVWILDSSEFELADLEANTISLLSAPEKARYARYDLARSKRQLLLSRAMLRTVLARYVEDEVLQISLGAHGRHIRATASWLLSLGWEWWVWM